MRAWSSARYMVPLPAGHRFPIAKYPMIRDGVVARGLFTAREIHEPDRIERWALGLAHTTTYASAVCDGTLAPAAARRIGFPWSEALRERSLRTAQGTIDAARDALASGAGINLAGGTHHAFANHGEGYCVFNDVALAIRVLQREGVLRRAVVVDLDVHHGNGTASIFAGDPDVFTFSMHADRNYPQEKPPSRLDVALPDGCPDSLYLGALDANLDNVLDEARAELVFYLAGADPYAGDRLGRLQLSKDGLATRDRRVFEGARRRGLPVVVTLAGGYAEDLADVVDIHANTVRELRVAYG